MQRYFIEEEYVPDELLVIDGENFHHMKRVMRMDIADQVYLVFKDQTTIIAEITQINDETIELKEVHKESQAKELPGQITIAMGYPKGDKLDLVVQKGTELGAYAFIGFPAATSVVKWDAKKLAKKEQRLTKIAQEAAEQSHRQFAPSITLLNQKEQLFALFSDYDAVIVAYEEAAKQGEMANLVQVLQRLQPNDKLLAIFGPEGGITPQEVTEMTHFNAVLCGLGPRILRTETAPFYLLSAASYQWELTAD